MKWQRWDGFIVSDDPARLDVERVWRWLAEESYWASGRPRDVVARSIAGSICFGLYDSDANQVGFCRWVTDRATFAWLADVFVAPTVRGSGLGSWMVGVAIDHPAVVGITRQVLATRDAHELYGRAGFAPLRHPERWMERLHA